MRKTLDDQIIEQEVRRDKFQQLQQPMAMKAIPAPRIRNEEENKGPPQFLINPAA